MAEVEKAIDTKNKKTNEFMAKRNVVGVGVGYKNKLGENTGDPSVVVLVQQKKPAAALTEEDMIPSEVNGTKTDVVEIGVLRAQGLNPKAEFRPVIQPGISLAHYMVGAGTFGAVVRDNATGEKLILSNNHVLANSNDAQAGDSILQPSSMDGGMIPSDVVANLLSFRRLAYIEDATVDDGGGSSPAPDPGETDPGPDTGGPDPSPQPDPDDDGNGFMGFLIALANLLARLTGSSKRAQAVSSTMAAQAVNVARAQSITGGSPAEVPFMAQASLDNLMDVALARPVNTGAVSDEILQIGRITGTKAPDLGMELEKFGRTTGYTTGRISLLDATVNVQYDTLAGTRTARFVGQVITTSMSKSGDSGSLVVSQADKQAVGLLFAGSEFASIFTPIDRVLSTLNVSLLQ